MADEFQKASKLFNKFLKLTLGSYLKYLFGFRVYNDRIAGLKPPYIILANHTNLWDPFLLSMCIPDPVYFVTSDIHFRNRGLRMLLKLVGAIPKTKFVSDPQTIKDIFKVAKNGGIIGIFPEGERNWDGSTLPLLYPTAKLIKKLGLPVVTILFKGSYLSMPRWAKYTRKGELDMICSRTLEAKDIEAYDAEDIYRLIGKSLEHNEYEYQRSRMIPYRGKAPAEKLELFLFCCPHCKSIGTMFSRDADFNCRKCSYSVRYNEFGFFTGNGPQLYFDNPGDWNLWQLKHLQDLKSSGAMEHTHIPLFEDNDILMQTGGRLAKMKKLQTGKLSIYPDRIVFQDGGEPAFSFSLDRIYGENTQLNSQLEFYQDKLLYKFTSDSYPMSSYKWVQAIKIFRQTPES